MAQIPDEVLAANRTYAAFTICGIVSRGDFKGIEIEELEDEEHLLECTR
jgi:hypothetical protein